MADDALKCIKAFLEDLPTWIADIEHILNTATVRQNEVLFEQQPVDETQYHPRRRRSSSVCTRPIHNAEGNNKHEVERPESQTPLLRPQMPYFTDSDVLRLSQRKRKTASVCSGDQSGPRKYRSRAMIVVYYDGDIQKRFEKLVRDIGIGRNAVRKGKLGSGMTRLSRASSGASDDSSGGEEEVLDLGRLQYKSVRLMRGDSSGGESSAFDKIDVHVEHSQNLCERAAHQILRDGDCALELNNAKKELSKALKVAEEELPKLEERSRRNEESRSERDDWQGAEHAPGEAADQPDENSKPKQADSAPAASPVPSLVPDMPSDAKLEADLEADDGESDDDAQFVPEALGAGKYKFSRNERLTAH